MDCTFQYFMMGLSIFVGENSVVVPLVYFQFRKQWHYLYTTPVESEALNKVSVSF